MLHDRVGFTFRRLRERADPLTGKAACDKLFVCLTSVSAGAVVLDHNACYLIKPSATVNVVPHLDHQTDQLCRLMKFYDVFSKLGEHDRTSYLELVSWQLECELGQTET